jgi:1-deoxyxylulose-5-phosphate synthase
VGHPVTDLGLTVDLVEMGKVRYIGASSMYAYQFLGLQHVAERNGWTKFISMQNYYNLIYREEEREMLPACKESGVGFFPLIPCFVSPAYDDLA